MVAAREAAADSRVDSAQRNSEASSKAAAQAVHDAADSMCAALEGRLEEARRQVADLSTQMQAWQHRAAVAEEQTQREVENTMEAKKALAVATAETERARERACALQEAADALEVGTR